MLPGGCHQLGYAVLDAPGKHLEVWIGDEVAGDAERDVVAVREDRNAGAHRRGDGHVGDYLHKAAAHPVQRLTGTWHVRGDRDDLPLGRERHPDPPGREQVRSVVAQADQRFADQRFPARLQRLQLGADSREPFYRIGDVDREIGNDRRHTVVVDVLVARSSH
jgi:hypothetical protein